MLRKSQANRPAPSSADGQYALTCGADRTIKLWRPSKLLQLKCYKGHSSDVIDCQANEDSSQFVSCSNDKSVIVWDVESGKILRRFRNLAPFSSLAYGHQSQTVFASSLDGTVKVYDLRAVNAWEPIQTLTDADDSVTCCRIHDHLIFTSSMDKCLRTYDMRQGILMTDAMHHPLNHVAVNRDASSLLVSCVRANPVLVDRDKAQILNEFSGNQNKLFKIESTFALDGSCVVAGSEDSKVYLWDVASKSAKLTLTHANVHPPVIQTVSSDSLDYLLTGCANYMFMWAL